LVEKHARKRPNHPAIKYNDQLITYAELNQTANRYAHFMARSGVRKGDKVAIMFDNRPEILTCTLATLKLGAVASMINTSQRGQVLLHSLNLIDCKLIIAGSEHISAVEDILPDMPPGLAHLATNGLFYLADPDTANDSDSIQETSKTIQETSKAIQKTSRAIDLDSASQGEATSNLTITQGIQLKDPCYYIFTSGTTGLPKASVMSHYRWFKCMAGVGIASLRLRSSDTIYIPLPFYHNNALTMSLGAALGAGATIAISRKFSASRFWDEIRDYQATCFCYIGELCRYLLNKEANDKDTQHQIRVIIGNGLRADLWDAFQNRFGIERINEFYGASECNLVFTNAINIEKTAGFCPLSYQIVKYNIDLDCVERDKQGMCIPVGLGESGLLLTAITPRSPFDGYTDKAASEKKILNHVLKADDCYFNTGDLVFNQGYRHVCFVDRLGDTFRWKGENVATTEVESVAAQFPAIEHAIVYGVEIAHSDGRAGMASVSIKEGCDLDLQAFLQHLNQHLPPYAVPVFIRIQARQQVTGTFKYQKGELKKQGFDIEQSADPILVRLPKTSTYQTLTPDLLNQINQGQYGF
jgi:fatty-acyl-CoA synthase/citronellyl-CoA synthetase